MAANYDNSAWFYDRLSRVVFGQALVRAQTYFLNLIPANSNVLIAGGGTGWILEEIAKVHPSGLNIVYVEMSQKMMALSKKRNTANNTITYINAPVEQSGLTGKFDFMITPFLLDSLSDSTLNSVFASLNFLLHPQGLWLNTDFQLSGKWWQRVLLKTMYIFFKLIGCTVVMRLPQIKQRFELEGYMTVNEQTFFGDFIVSTLYKKQA